MSHLALWVHVCSCCLCLMTKKMKKLKGVQPVSEKDLWHVKFINSISSTYTVNLVSSTLPVHSSYIFLFNISIWAFFVGAGEQLQLLPAAFGATTHRSTASKAFKALEAALCSALCLFWKTCRAEQSRSVDHPLATVGQHQRVTPLVTPGDRWCYVDSLSSKQLALEPTTGQHWYGSITTTTKHSDWSRILGCDGFVHHHVSNLESILVAGYTMCLV